MTDETELRAEIARLRMRLAQSRADVQKVLHLYSGAWHPNSILAQEYGAEIEAIRNRAIDRAALKELENTDDRA